MTTILRCDICNTVKFQTRADNSKKTGQADQAIIDMNRNGNFYEGTWILKIIASANVDARAVLLKKSTGFCRMPVTASLLRLGAFFPT